MTIDTIINGKVVNLLLSFKTLVGVSNIWLMYLRSYFISRHAKGVGGSFDFCYKVWQVVGGWVVFAL